MFDLSWLSVKSPDARVAFGFDLAAEAVQAQPASLNIDNLPIDHTLAHESFSGCKAARPSHLSATPTAEAPAPQPSSINMRATQVAGSPATEFISPRVGAFAVCFESTLRRTMRFRLPSMSRRCGRFID
jgi:hypothetical protein